MCCVFGILFIFLGNLAGNSVSFGINVLIAAGKDPIYDKEHNYYKGQVIGFAIAVPTICVALHMFSRKGGILINNVFAVTKVGILLTIILLGWIHASGKLQSTGINEKPKASTSQNVTITSQNVTITSDMINSASKTNFDTSRSFHVESNDFSTVVQALLYAIYPYTGFEQPFYVLSEVRKPRRIFPSATIGAMVLTTILYMLVNISYFCVVPAETYTLVPSNTIDMAGTFFHYLFDTSNPSDPRIGRRVIAALKAFSVLGNTFVLTYTAARVKQEIAKEGIIPFSLFFATGHTTILAKLGSLLSSNPAKGSPLRRSSNASIDLDKHLEQSPMAALGLQWVTSVLLVALTSMCQPKVAYSFLVGLYSYSIVAVLGMLTAGGLLYLKFDSYFYGPDGRRWYDKCAWPETGTWVRKVSGLYALVYFLVMAFLLFASFVPSPPGSSFSQAVQGYSPYLVSGIGLSSVTWGVIWWAGLMWREWKGRWMLKARRTPYVEPDGDGGWVQRVEVVDHERVRRPDGLRRRMFEMDRLNRGEGTSV